MIDVTSKCVSWQDGTSSVHVVDRSLQTVEPRVNPLHFYFTDEGNTFLAFGTGALAARSARHPLGCSFTTAVAIVVVVVVIVTVPLPVGLFASLAEGVGFLMFSHL